MLPSRVKEQQRVFCQNNAAVDCPKKWLRSSAEYGTAPPGSQATEMRAKKAARHIAREVLQLCQVIEEYGRKGCGEHAGTVTITFGQLFQVYQFISDKLVGMLLRARKHGMVAFEGEMLYQRRDEHIVVSLLLSHNEIESSIRELK